MTKNQEFPIYHELKKILELSKSYLTENEINEVDHFLQHNELDIAFETLIGIIVERNLGLPKTFIDLLKIIFSELKEFNDEHWEKIEIWKHINAIKVEG